MKKISPLKSQGTISSTRIRKSLQNGHIEYANKLLSRTSSLIFAVINSYSLLKEILSIWSTTLDNLVNEYFSFSNFFKIFLTLIKFLGF